MRVHLKKALLFLAIVQFGIWGIYKLSHTDLLVQIKLQLPQFTKSSQRLYYATTTPSVSTRNTFRTNTTITLKISNCGGLNLSYPIGLASKESWLPVGNDQTREAYVFSAYHEVSYNNKTIRIFGAKTKATVTYICQFWYRGDDSWSMMESQATGQYLHSSGLRYVACNFICQLPSNRMPETVSLVTRKCSTPTNLLPIRNIKTTTTYDRRFTVCLSPLNYHYGRAYELIEWFELNRILGAQKFIIYNYEIAENVNQVLHEYSKNNITEIVNWNLPMAVNKYPPKKSHTSQIAYFGQIAALNDCLYRNKGVSEYVVNLDVDEFIIPHGRMNTWQDIIDSQPKKGGYLFKNVFFRKEWNQTDLIFDGKEHAEKFQLVTLLKAQRENKIWPPSQRSKYIARTSAVERMVTHDIDRLKSGQSKLFVQPEVGLLHHYRNWLNYNDPQPRITDTTVLDKYRDDLIHNVAKIRSNLQNVKMEIPFVSSYNTSK